jgi:hypothetical protein
VEMISLQVNMLFLLMKSASADFISD